MKKLLLTVISFLFLANVLFAQTNEDLLIDEIVSQVDTEELRFIIEQLSGEIPLYDGSIILTRFVGTDGKEIAADYIVEQYSDIENLTVKKEEFNPLVMPLLLKLLVGPFISTIPQGGQDYYEHTLNSWMYFGKKHRTRRWENILAVLKGENKEPVFTTAHYDSKAYMPGITEVMEDSYAPGADDNATGVAATIIAARILSQYSFENSICFLNPDAEEIGLLGSASYVFKHLLGLGRIKSVINVDMIGYDDDNDGSMMITYGEDEIKDIIANEDERLLLNIDPVFTMIDIRSSDAAPITSDHIPFYLFGVKRAVGFFENIEGEINVASHTEDETVETINFDYMTEIVKLYIATLAREAGVIGRR